MQKQNLKKIKPVTPSQRGLKLLKKIKFWQRKFLKTSIVNLLKKAGRNHKGRITLFHRGGGHKKLYRLVDFGRKNSQGIVQGLEYDPYRNAYLARIFCDKNSTYYYILAPKNLFTGCYVRSGLDADIKIGHAMPLHKVPVGSLIHNLSVGLKKQGQYARAAGTYAQLIQKIKNYARIRLSSGEQRLVSLNATATLGVVSNENFSLLTDGKAGRSRWKGNRPHVRGVAMNPVDHPHGGGEGKTSGGRPAVTPWGKPARGPKTSKSKNPLILVSRKNKN